MPKNTKQSARGKKPKSSERFEGIKAWGFLNDEGYMYPLDVCPVFDSEDWAKAEKKSSPIYYGNTTIIPVLITPLPTPRRKGRVSKK